MLLYCIPGFVAFKDLAHEHNLHFVTPHAWYWCLIGFIIFGVRLILSRLSSKLTITFSWSTWGSWWRPSSRGKRRFIVWNPLLNRALTRYITSLLPSLDTTFSASNPGSLKKLEVKGSATTFSDNIPTGPQPKLLQPWNGSTCCSSENSSTVWLKASSSKGQTANTMNFCFTIS